MHPSGSIRFVVRLWTSASFRSGLKPETETDGRWPWKYRAVRHHVRVCLGFSRWKRLLSLVLTSWQMQPGSEGQRAVNNFPIHVEKLDLSHQVSEWINECKFLFCFIEIFSPRDSAPPTTATTIIQHWLRRDELIRVRNRKERNK